MGCLIDSSEIIFIERNRKNIAELIIGREEENFFISVITASELLHGVARAKDIVTKTRRSAFVEAVLSQFPLLAIDLPVARIHAELWTKLTSEGAIIGLHDSWIAATCLAHDLTLLTSNLKEFARVPELKAESLRNSLSAKN